DAGLVIDDRWRQADCIGGPRHRQLAGPEHMVERIVLADPRDILSAFVLDLEAGIADAAGQRLDRNQPAPERQCAHALFGRSRQARPRLAFMRLTQAVISRSATMPMKAIASPATIPRPASAFERALKTSWPRSRVPIIAQMMIMLSARRIV